MLTKTTEVGIQALMHLARIGTDTPVSSIAMARELGVSPTYFSKIMAQLVRANILRAHRGTKGGLTLARDSKKLTLLDIVQALQGTVLARYCQQVSGKHPVCAFHQAMQDLNKATVAALTRWRLADLLKRPFGEQSQEPRYACLMQCLRVSHVKPRQGRGPV